jgi:hypothetical protein
VLPSIPSFSFALLLRTLGYLCAALQITPMMIYLFDYRKMNNSNNNKHQGIVVVVALIAGASLLSLGAVAATTITQAFAWGDDDDDKNGDSVKQKAKSKNNCRNNEAEDNERAGVDQNQQGGGPVDCIAVSANVNDFELILPGPGIPVGIVDGKLVQYD